MSLPGLPYDSVEGGRLAQEVLALVNYTFKLAWSVRFVDVLVNDIITAFDEQRVLAARGQHARERDGAVRPAREKFGVTALLETLLADYRAKGSPLPGRRRRDGTIGVNLPHLAKLLDVAPSSLRVLTNQALLDAADLPIQEGSPLAAPITAHLDGAAWRDNAVGFHEAPALARHLSTACFIVIAYLSGMRPGEKRAELRWMQHSSRLNTGKLAGQAATSDQLAS